MDVKFYKNASDPRVVSKNITLLSTNSCQVVDPCSLVNPSIKVLKDDTLIPSNYMYIEKFGRYYFITETTFDGQFMIFTGHSDWRMSFQNQLLSGQIVVDRSSSNSDAYVPDPMVTVKDSITTYIRKMASSPFTGPSGSNNYVLTIGGK